MNKRKLWCFMQAFSYPLSIIGILALVVLLGLVTKTPEIVIIPFIIPVAFAVALFIGFAVKELLDCYENYRNRVRKIEGMED